MTTPVQNNPGDSRRIWFGFSFLLLGLLIAVLSGTGTVDWDVITALKTAMDKGDSTGIIQLLQKLRPNDLVATLSTLAKRGTPSDLLMLRQPKKPLEGKS